MHGLPLFVCTFLMCFGILRMIHSDLGGSTFTSIVHGQMLGYLRRSIGFVSYLICTYVSVWY